MLCSKVFGFQPLTVRWDVNLISLESVIVWDALTLLSIVMGKIRWVCKSFYIEEEGKKNKRVPIFEIKE